MTYPEVDAVASQLRLISPLRSVAVKPVGVEGGGGADRAAIREHLSGNYCRCTGYQSIVDAVCDVIEGERP